MGTNDAESFPGEPRGRVLPGSVGNSACNVDLASMSRETMERLHRDLLAHQIELELQNDELLRAQGEAEGARARYQALYDEAPTGYCTASSTTHLIEANLTLARMVGVSRVSMIGKPLTRFVHNEDQDKLYFLRRELAADRLRHQCDLRLRSVAEGAIWVHVEACAEMDALGELRVRYAFSDATALHRERRRLKDIVDGTGAATWEWDIPTGAIVHNTLWHRMLGLPEGDPLKSDRTAFLGLVHPDDIARAAPELAAHLRGETETFQAEYRVRRANGDWIWVHEHGRATHRDKDGVATAMSGIRRDITDRKTIEAEREEAKRQAEAASRSKSLFLATMSHELRTPLNGVLGMADLLERRIVDPEQRTMVTAIQESGALLLAVINDVLDFSKIEAGHLDLDPKPFVPAAVARRVIDVHRPTAESKGLAIHLLVEGTDDLRFVGDAHRVEQILHNLVGNAVKFTAKGSVDVRLDCTSGAPLAIEVSDTGIGMTPEQCKRVFDDFVQCDRSTSRTFGGIGLGLAITRRLVDAMGGRIEVQSSLGQGTRMRVVLPLSTLHAQAASANTDVPSPPLDLRVLVADDNAVNRFILSAMLTSLGARSVVAESGEQALEAFALEPFDVVLLDISMPQMDGFETLARIRDHETRISMARTPVIAVTAYALTHEVQNFLASGFDAHVGKPIDMDALSRTISTWTTKRDLSK